MLQDANTNTIARTSRASAKIFFIVLPSSFCKYFRGARLGDATIVAHFLALVKGNAPYFTYYFYKNIKRYCKNAFVLV